MARLACVVGILATVFMTTASGASSASLECGACLLVVAEVEEAIRAVDPNKVVESGSYRVNSQGDQVGLQKVSFARSNTHIVELLESVCGKTTEYKLVVNTLTGKKVYVNKKSTFLDGDESKGMQSKLHGACNDLTDDHVETFEEFFRHEHADAARELCTNKLGVCTSVDVSPLPPMEPPKTPDDDVVDVDSLNDEL